jgi:hypothetical protein
MVMVPVLAGVAEVVAVVEVEAVGVAVRVSLLVCVLVVVAEEVRDIVSVDVGEPLVLLVVVAVAVVVAVGVPDTCPITSMYLSGPSYTLKHAPEEPQFASPCPGTKGKSKLASTVHVGSSLYTRSFQFGPSGVLEVKQAVVKKSGHAHAAGSVSSNVGYTEASPQPTALCIVMA